MTKITNSAKAMAETTAKKQKRGAGKPFEKGVSGNPAGRPKGSRNKLSEEFLSALCADFEEHGVASIVSMRENDPSSYVKVVAGSRRSAAIIPIRGNFAAFRPGAFCGPDRKPACIKMFALAKISTAPRMDR